MADVFSRYLGRLDVIPCQYENIPGLAAKASRFPRSAYSIFPASGGVSLPTEMADDSSILVVRSITKILADLDFLFTVGKGPDGTLWTLGFEDEETHSKILVQLRVHENWLVIYHSTLAPVPLTEVLAKKLLYLNTQIPISRVGLQENNIVISAQLMTSRLDTESLKEAIGAVVALSGQVLLAVRNETAH